MTPLRQRMQDAMLQRGFAARTQESYIDAIARMAKYYRRDPATYSAQEVEAYLLHLIKDRHLSYSTTNQAACAARFLFEVVLGEPRERFVIPLAKAPVTQPELLSRQQIAQLLAACISPARRMLMQTIYATGLRVSEACALRVADIDSAADRRCIRVTHGKGGKDRYTLLSATLLTLLRGYARTYKPGDWLFGDATGTQAHRRERRAISRQHRRRSSTQRLRGAGQDHDQGNEAEAEDVGYSHRGLWNSQVQVRERSRRRNLSGRLLVTEGRHQHLRHRQCPVAGGAAFNAWETQDGQGLPLC